jgi:hypothetical protein
MVMKINKRFFAQFAASVAAYFLFTNSYAACLIDEPEMGDVGPASELVCESLAGFSRVGEVKIIDRDILAPDRVSIRVETLGRQIVLGYKLIGMEWRHTEDTTVALGKLGR